MSIGICCQYLVEKNNKFINIMEERNLQFGQFKNNKYSDSFVLSTWINNLSNFHSVFKRIVSEGIKVIRLSSNLFPLFDLLPHLHNDKELNSLLETVGKDVLSNNIRLTTHPSQFCVISSTNPSVIQNSFQLLFYHAWIFDRMNLPETTRFSINIHGGTKNQSEKLIESILKLPSNTRKRLTLENDELSYSVKDLYKIYQKTSVPIVLDSHHHSFNKADLSLEEALDLSISTWEEEKPLTHLSNTDPKSENANFQEKRKHSEYVHYIPECQRVANNEDKIDIEFEFKNKNLAIFKAIKDFDIKL